MKTWYVNPYDIDTSPWDGCDSMYEVAEVDKRIKELEAENARLRQQLNSANSQIQILNRVIAGDIE